MKKKRKKGRIKKRKKKGCKGEIKKDKSILERKEIKKEKINKTRMNEKKEKVNKRKKERRNLLYECYSLVMYFDQRTHAWACVRMVENDQKHSII